MSIHAKHTRSTSKLYGTVLNKYSQPLYTVIGKIEAPKTSVCYSWCGSLPLLPFLTVALIPSLTAAAMLFRFIDNNDKYKASILLQTH